MKKSELQPKPIGTQHLWWLKRVNTPMGSARNSERIPVIVMSEFYKWGSSKEARSIDVKEISSGHISRQDWQVLQVMTDDEKRSLYAEIEAKNSNGKPKPKSRTVDTPSNSIVRRDGVARELARDFGISIVQANRNLRQFEQTLTKLLLEKNRIVFMDWLSFDTIETPAKRVGDVRTGKPVIIPASRKLTVAPSIKLKSKIKALA